MVSTSAWNTDDPWFESRSWYDRFLFVNIHLSADLTKGSFGHFSSFYVIIILKTSKISIFCMFLQESQISSNM